MKNYILKFSLVALLFGTTYTSLQAQEVSEEKMANITETTLQEREVSEEAMENMTKILDLSELQQGQMNDLLVKYRGSIDWILSKNEGEEEPDILGMIAEIRGERDGYRAELATILSEQQHEIYKSRMDEILTDMFRDLAEIRLWDVQREVALTDKQVADLTPIVGKSLKGTVQLLFENAGTKLSLPKKVKLKNAMKKIEKEKREAMESILTPAQMGAYEQFKEEQKAAMKAKKK